MQQIEISNVSEIHKHIVDAPIGRYIGDRGAKIFAERADSILELEDGEHLYNRGDDSSSFFIVYEGHLELVKLKKKGKPKVLHIFKKGDLVGELSFIDDTQRFSTILAQGTVKVLQFKAEDIRPLILQEPQVMFDFMRAVIRRAHSIMDFISKQQSALSDYISYTGKR